MIFSQTTRILITSFLTTLLCQHAFAGELNEFQAKGSATVHFAALQEKVASRLQHRPIVGALIDPVALRGVEDVHLEGDFAYLPCREGQRLTICSIKDPTKPTVVSSFTHRDLGQAAGFAINGDTIYLTSQSNSKLLVIDASDKTALRLVGSTQIGPAGKGILYKVAYRNGHWCPFGKAAICDFRR